MSKYDTLNPMQREAVYTEGPLLVTAGAGSGKTRVLTPPDCVFNRGKTGGAVEYHGDHFTNKAAAEMRERVDKIWRRRGGDLVSIVPFELRSDSAPVYRPSLGYDTNFTIYDGDDQKTLMKQVLKKNAGGSGSSLRGGRCCHADFCGEK